jgi:uncharacterized protein YndB with AHSA1/START domain
MHRLRFSIDIEAPRERVWKVLWDDETFRDWTSVFSEFQEKASYIKSEWREVGRFEFFQSGAGSYGVIEKLVPNELVSFRHLGEIREGKDVPSDQGSLRETYTLVDRDGFTTLSIEHDVPEELKGMFEEMSPKTLERVKALSER